ncbi:unnamed protein product [Meganyctiphanes norvegica]|uniref:Uncharacterized protein n=1 Tax=Meganyctiphanes norvegica TaxID=48144 RepID=A0AAV2RZ74_MEGNR
MFIVSATLLILLFILMKESLLLIEKQHHHSKNGTFELTHSLVDDMVDIPWLKNDSTISQEVSSTGIGSLKKSTRIEPNLDLLLGTFEHEHDENFAELLEAVGAPAFIRAVILTARPTVTVEILQLDDYYYYDIDDHPSDLEQQYIDTEGESEPYQFLVKACSWLACIKERFRIGYTYTKTDFDGNSGENTFYFLSPSITLHEKIRSDTNSLIYREFTEDQLIVTVVENKVKMIAKRFYTRVPSTD